MKRIDGRAFDQLRSLKITPGFLNYAEGSALIELGSTRVLCAVSLDEKVPQFVKGSGNGWLTSEYSMLPRATLTRSQRESSKGRVGGRTHEIQRLIGRSLRSIVDMRALGERCLIVDCDVLQADGGTRTAAITGSYVALYQAMKNLQTMGLVSDIPIKANLAAISAGVVKGSVLLDLCYDEDCIADCDFNIVMTGKGEIVEVQGTAETKPFSHDTLGNILTLAEKGIRELFTQQQLAIQAI